MNQRIADALQVLYEEGLKHYKPEYRDGINKWDAIGRSLSDTDAGALDVARLAYSYWEDWNYHDVCAVLDWVFPQLHNMRPFEPAVDYLDTLKRVKRAITRPPQQVFTTWNDEKMGYDVGTYALEVSLVEVEEEDGS